MTSFFIPYDQNRKIDENGEWNGYTLLLPCISVGNVPQLSIELLINRFIKNNNNDKDDDLEMIGYLYCPYVRPFAGPDPFKFDGNLLSTSIQVFESKSKKLIIIQQRSPIYREYREDFYRLLFDWLSKHQLENIIILSSTFDQYLAPEFMINNDDDDQKGLTIMYLSSDNMDEKMEKFLSNKLNIKPVMKIDPDTMKPSENGKIFIPGSGSAKSYVRYGKNLSKSIICLIMYCSEGDNRYHSYYFINKIIDLLNLTNNLNINKDENKWIEPFSWRMMFGNEPPSEIY